MRSRVSPLLLAAVLATLLPGCSTLSEWWGGVGDPRTDLLGYDRAWDAGQVPPESVGRARDAIARLGRVGFSTPEGRAALPDLARIAITSRPSLVRADALRACWQLVADVPAEAYVDSEFDLDAFNARAKDLALLLDDPARAQSQEGLDLAQWLGAQRLPPRYALEGVSLAGAILSQARYWGGSLGQAFADVYPGVARHAVVLATLRATVDDASLVRLEALRWLHLVDPALAYPIVSATLARETDSLLLVVALDSLEAISPSLTRAQIEQAVQTLPLEPDPAVRRRLERLLASLS